MGVNNKQRRATRKKARRAHREVRPPEAPGRFIPEMTPDLVRSCLLEVLRDVGDDSTAAARWGALLLRADGPVPPGLARSGLRHLLTELVRNVVRNGWSPSDLAQITLRRAGEPHVPAMLAVLHEETGRHPAETVDAGWREELMSWGSPRVLDLGVADDVQLALELGSTLVQLPAIPELRPPPGATPRSRSGASGDPKLLARVRALLAKAESTEFPEEAELLSAKAQELVSRHALEQLLAADDDTSDDPTAARRLWLEAPYVLAKGLLVAAVADANRCRSVMSQGLGCCTVVGRPGDLAAVDVLVTSLLVQAHAAMLRSGRQTDTSGTSRTKSFRQSFLVSYASRIRERLHDAADHAVRSTGRSGELVPVLARQAEQLDSACQAMFPRLVSREARIGNYQGWAAGRAAADQARLDTDLPLTAAG
ncbi:MAG: DUF2786 domain-containing protein [Frankiaceae bacterium]|nr:DUF2786 domain-containing protein [Frankiaceae bacterium]